MFTRIATVALNTYREASRARVLYGLVGLAVATALYSIVIGSYTLRSAARTITDIGVATLSLYAVVVAVVISASSLHRELERKTLFPILARPIRRAEYLTGKYLGTLLTIWVFILINASMVLLILAGMGGRSIPLVVGVALAGIGLLIGLMWKVKQLGTFAPIPWVLVFFGAAYVLSSVHPLERSVVVGMSLLAMFEVSIVTGFAMLFSSFSSPFLSALLTLGVFVMGRQADNLARLPAKVFGQQIHEFGVLLSKVVPNLQVYVPTREVVSGEALDVRPLTYLSWASLQALGWSVGLMIAAGVIFRKRDFL